MSMRLLRLDTRTRQRWLASWPQLVFALVVLVLVLARAGQPVKLVFTLGALTVGLYLVRTSPAAYVSFVLWLWMWTAFIRRIADYYSYWQEPSLVLLTPYIVTAFSAIPTLERIFRRRPAEPHERPIGVAMFGFVAMAVAIGMPMGFVANPMLAVQESLNYLVPLLLGWFVATHAYQLHDIEERVMRTFAAATLFVGAYGVYQFTRAPIWDVVWMVNSEMGSIGVPEPFGIRVFSTMHSPGVLAGYLAVALVLWLAHPRIRATPGAGLVGVTLLLSQARSAWLAFIAGAVLLIAALKPSQQLRAGGLVVLATLAMGVFLVTPEMSQLVDERMSTMERLDEDSSALARMAGHELALEFASRRPLGVGIGQSDSSIDYYISMRDSVIVAALVQFGLIGAILYFIGLALLFTQLWRYYRRGAGPSASALAAASLGLLAMLALGVVTAGPLGIPLWLIAGLAVADRHQARLRAVRVLAMTESALRARATADRAAQSA